MSKWDKLEQNLRKKCPGLELRQDENMSNHTALHIGGPVTLMALPKTKDEVMDSVYYAYQQHIKPFFIGSGSNVLATDKNYEGFVIKTSGLDRLEPWKWNDLKKNG